MPLTEDLLYHRELHEDSDSEDEDSEDEDGALVEQKNLRRKFRNRTPGVLKVSACVILNCGDKFQLADPCIIYSVKQRLSSGHHISAFSGRCVLRQRWTRPLNWQRRRLMQVTAA